MQAKRQQEKRKQQIRRLVAPKKNKQCEKCKPNLELTPDDHSPILAELAYVTDNTWKQFLALSDGKLAFLHKYGYNSYQDCVDRGYDPKLDTDEIKEVDKENLKYF